MITAKNWYLQFEGAPQDALSFVQEMRELQNDTGLEFGKVLSDFLFAIEVALQNEGLLDENFDVVEK